MGSIKYITGFLIIAVVVFFTRNYIKQKEDIKRINANHVELVNAQNSLISEYHFKLEEMNRFMQVKFPELVAKIDSVNIRPKTINQITIQEIQYKDTTEKRLDLSPILNAIKKEANLTLPIEDISPCMIVRGFVRYKNGSLTLDITDREYTSVTEVVSHWERQQWKLFGLIPTRLFGKKQVELTVFNDCGESKTIIINNNGR